MLASFRGLRLIILAGFDMNNDDNDFPLFPVVSVEIKLIIIV